MKQEPRNRPQPSPEIIAVVGQEVGCGATTTAVNLALGLAAAGRSVLLMDLAPDGGAGRALGYSGNDRGGTASALLEAAITREMIAATRITEIYLAPAGAGLIGIERELEGMDDSCTRLFQALLSLHELSLEFDHVILDCRPSLDVLTRNALVAAHRVLLPIACDSPLPEGLPAVLKLISRLRAGRPQPFYGTYLLAGRCSAAESARALIASIRQEYGPMTLLTEIPLDATLDEAAAQNQPLLMHDRTCAISEAFMSLAAEWLTLSELGDQRDGTWRLKARRERMAGYRKTMLAGIQGWRIDPLSRLYDPDEAMRAQDTMALETLFEAARPSLVTRLRQRLGRTSGIALLAAVLVALALGGPILAGTDAWRLELGAWLIGTEHSWQAGSLLLARADERAYRELVLASRLVERNRAALMRCGEVARETEAETDCRIRVSTPDMHARAVQ